MCPHSGHLFVVQLNGGRIGCGIISGPWCTLLTSCEQRDSELINFFWSHITHVNNSGPLYDDASNGVLWHRLKQHLDCCVLDLGQSSSMNNDNSVRDYFLWIASRCIERFHLNNVFTAYIAAIDTTGMSMEDYQNDCQHGQIIHI